METMLSDGNVVEKLAKLKTKDKSLWQKIKDFISELSAKIRDVYNGLKPDSPEGRYVAEMKDAIGKLQEMFTDAIVDASENYQAADGQKNTTQEGDVKYSQRYLASDTNSEILSMVNRVTNGECKANDKVYLGTVSDAVADRIHVLTGIRVNGFKVAIEARQIEHILKDHGVNGASDHSMADPDDIARMEYALSSPDDIRKAGKSQAYTYMRDGRNRTADTVLYEKNIGTKSYYVVQAVPDTKAKTLYIVTAFIGKSGYKKEASQLINAKSLDATAKTGSASASKDSIRSDEGIVNKKFSDRDYSYEALVSKPDMAVTTVGGNVPNNRADVVYQAKQNAAKVGKFNPKDGSVSVYVDDIGKDVVLGTDGLKHGLRRTKDSGNDLNWIVTLHAGEIIKNSIRINELTPEKAEADGTYVLIGTAQSEAGDLYIVRSVVNQFSSELASMDVLYAIKAKKGNRLRSMRPGFQGPVTDSTISIAELLDYVNEYFSDILPEDVLKHYGHDARPEGKLGESALYSERDLEELKYSIQARMGSQRSIPTGEGSDFSEKTPILRKIKAWRNPIPIRGMAATRACTKCI